MAFSKQDIFTEKQIALAEFARALSHPARIAIITHLQEHGSTACGDLVKALPLAQPTVSQHLKALREAGLIEATSLGPKVNYSLSFNTIQSFCHAFQCTLGTIAEA